ncbi:MAG: fatty acid desaturase, partial [Verrucomicrobiota bacterium]
TNGDLDQRGVGDVWTMTVEEYLDSPQRKRLAYRLVRNPFVLFVIAPIYLFLIRERWPIQNAKPREVRSVRFTNLAIACMAGLLIAVFGFWQWLAIQLILTVVSGGGGIWLFYIQHQYEGTYWERSEDWDYTDAALKGSSYYKLPRILQWFSGNIGFHHIHHLSPRIPNYHLEACHHSDPIFSEVVPTTILGSLKALTFRLWDEERKELISFRQLNDQLKAEREAVG